MSEAKHHKGRLACEGNGDGGDFLLFAEGLATVIAEVTAEDVWAEESEANARRLVACWNACRGISTEDLERGAVTSDFIVWDTEKQEWIASIDTYDGAVERTGNCNNARVFSGQGWADFWPAPRYACFYRCRVVLPAPEANQ